MESVHAVERASEDMHRTTAQRLCLATERSAEESCCLEGAGSDLGGPGSRVRVERTTAGGESEL